jgi:hypothetical protein
MSNRQLYLIDQGNVSELDVSDLERVTASERYTREWICAYTETPQQALYCAKLYDHHLIQPSNTVIAGGGTYSVLTLPTISVRAFENASEFDELRGTLYVDRRNGEAWIDYQGAVYVGQLQAEASKQLLTCDLRDGEEWIDYQREVCVGHSQAEADKQLLTCRLPVNCTVTELEAMLYDLRHLIVAAALSPDRETAIDRERTLRESAAYIRNELGER